MSEERGIIFKIFKESKCELNILYFVKLICKDNRYR